MLKNVKLKTFLYGQLVRFQQPEVPGTPGYIEVDPVTEGRIRMRLFPAMPEINDDEYVFHGTTMDAALHIIDTGTFLPAPRLGFTGCTGVYFGCRRVAEIFALSAVAAVLKDRPEERFYGDSDSLLTPTLIAIKMDDLEAAYGERFAPDSIADTNPPSASHYNNGIVDLLCDEDPDASDRDLALKMFGLSGCIMIPTTEPLDISGPIVDNAFIIS